MTLEELQEQYDICYSKQRFWHNEITINVIAVVIFVSTYCTGVVVLKWLYIESSGNDQVALLLLFILSLSFCTAALLTYLSYTYLIEKHRSYYESLLTHAKALTSHIVFSQLQNVRSIEFMQSDCSVLLRYQMIEFCIKNRPVTYDLEFEYFVDQAWENTNSNIADIL